MPKPTKTDLTRYRKTLLAQLASLTGDVGSMRNEALRASEQDNSVDHLADQGSDNHDQAFMLGLIENEEETIGLIQGALERIDGKGDYPFGECPMCVKAVGLQSTNAKRGRKIEVWIPKARLEYLPWAGYCIQHQEDMERGREIA